MPGSIRPLPRGFGTVGSPVRGALRPDAGTVVRPWELEEEDGSTEPPPRSGFASTITWSTDAPADTDLYTFSSTLVADTNFAYNNAAWAAVPVAGTVTDRNLTCTFRAEGYAARKGDPAGIIHVVNETVEAGTLSLSGRFGLGAVTRITTRWFGDRFGVGDNEVEDGAGTALSTETSAAAPTLIASRGGQFVGVAFVTSSTSTVGAGLWVAERPVNGVLEAELLDASRSEYLQPAGVAYQRRLWVVFVGDAPDQTAGAVGNIYLVSRSVDGTWGSPIQVNDGDAACSFPSVAVSGDADANGAGSVLVVVWREDPATYVKDIYARAVLVDDFDTTGGFVNASSLVSDRSAYLISRDPCVWCSAAGLFFVGYSVQVETSKRPVAQVGVQTNANPADGASAWSSLAFVNYDEAVRQDFIYGCANGTDGRSVVVWEYGTSKEATIYGASCELSDPATWTVLGDRTTYPGTGISDEASGEYAQFPCCTLSNTGESGLFFVRSDGATKKPGAVAVRFRFGTLA